MGQAYKYWCELYKTHRHEAVALDIETQHFDGAISVVSLFKRPSEKKTELVQFTCGPELSSQSIRRELDTARLIITFNGQGFDIPRIAQEYPGSIPDEVPVLDLFLLAKAIGMHGGLKNMETVFGIRRSDRAEQAQGKTHRLWKRYRQAGDEHALHELLEYSGYDVRNLFDLADTLIQWAEAKSALEDTRPNRIHDHIAAQLAELLRN